MKVLVLEAHALHLAYLGTYGNDWVATPNLDRLASEGIVFDQMHACRPEPSWPVHPRRAARTGLLLPETPGEPLAVHTIECPTLAGFAPQVQAELERAAEEPIVWVEGPSLAPPWDLPNDLLDSYFDEDEDKAPWPDPPLGPFEAGFDLPRLQNTYAGVVTAFDAHVGRIVEWLQQRGLYETCWICVLSSSGLALGEHRVVGGPSLHEEVIHVPMVWRLPGGAESGSRIDALVQPTDLVPSIREHLGMGASPGHGFSLWPLVRGELAAVRPYSVAVTEGASMLRAPGWSLLVAGEQRHLHVKPEDRWEVNDLSSKLPEQTDRMEAALKHTLASATRAEPLAFLPLEDAGDTTSPEPQQETTP